MPPMIPIEFLSSGEAAEVVDVSGDPAVVHRLAELGLRPGVVLKMLQPGCPCLFELGGCRLSMRTDELVQILVQPLNQAKEVA